VLSGLLVAPSSIRAEEPTQAQILERLQRLEENQAKLYEMLRSKDERIEELEAELDKAKAVQEAAPAAPAAPVPAAGAPVEPAPVAVAAAPTPAPAAEQERYFGTYEFGKGFGLARNEYGEVNFGVYVYPRYLNQKGLDKTYKNGDGEEVKIDRRDDVNLNKVKIEFRGWLFDPKFRYVLYTWTNNTAQGQGAQVVVAGNLAYIVGDYLTLGAGIASLPTTRSTQGNFPYWLAVDNRDMADEFFKGSYTIGFFAHGQIAPGVAYSAMLGNNLSQLGIDAGQLDGDFTTVSAALWWMPTTGEFGYRNSFGDYEDHKDVATRLGLHFTFSPEDRQSQPGTEDIDNSQIRLSNGTIVFSPGALAPGVVVSSVKYYMTAIDAGVKYRGFALEGEYYLRWLDDFKASGPLPDDTFFDHGFQLLGSVMIVPKTLQYYVTGSTVFGEYGDPWEVTTGMNWFIFRRREVRLNFQYIYDHHSPVGYLGIPRQVGGTGSIIDLNLEVNF